MKEVRSVWAVLADAAVHVSARARAYRYFHRPLSNFFPSPVPSLTRAPRYRDNNARIIPRDHAIARVDDLASPSSPRLNSGDSRCSHVPRLHVWKNTCVRHRRRPLDRSRGNFARERQLTQQRGALRQPIWADVKVTVVVSTCVSRWFTCVRWDAKRHGDHFRMFAVSKSVMKHAGLNPSTVRSRLYVPFSCIEDFNAFSVRFFVRVTRIRQRECILQSGTRSTAGSCSRIAWRWSRKCRAHRTGKRSKRAPAKFAVVVRQLGRRGGIPSRIAFVRRPEHGGDTTAGSGEGCETQRRLGESAFCFISQVLLKRSTGGLLAGEEFRYTKHVATIKSPRLSNGIYT